jgi:hypothetical protein
MMRKRLATTLLVGLIAFATMLFSCSGGAIFLAVVVGYCSSSLGCGGRFIGYIFQFSVVVAALTAPMVSAAYLALGLLPRGPRIWSEITAAMVCGLIFTASFVLVTVTGFFPENVQVQFVLWWLFSFGVSLGLLWLASPADRPRL